MANPKHAAYSDEELRATIRDLLAKVLKGKKVDVKPESVSDDTSLSEELGIDSLDVLQILATVEKQYKIKIPEDQFKNIDDIRGILKVVKKHLPGRD